MNEWWLLSGFLFLLIIALVIVLYPLRRLLKISMTLAPIIFALVVFAYWRWGAWADLNHYLHQQARLEQAQAMLKSIHNPQELIDKFKLQLAKQPGSARGWFLLGRIYASQDQWAQAHDAYARAHQLKPDNEQTTVNYVQSLWQLNHQKFNGESRALLQAVLKKNANQPDALAMLAMDAFIGHAYQRAIDYWQRLLKIAPPQSDDAEAIRKAIAKAQQHVINGVKS